MALAPLCVFIVWIGVQPKFFLDRMGPSVDRLSQDAMNVAAVESREPATGNQELGAGRQESGVRRQESVVYGNSIVMSHFTFFNPYS